jgi:hypothetical protein
VDPKRWSQWQRKRFGPLPGIEQQSSCSQSVTVLTQLLQFKFEEIFPISKKVKQPRYRPGVAQRVPGS